MANHPDRGGDLETMKAINAEYDNLFKMVNSLPALLVNTFALAITAFLCYYGAKRKADENG